jgi:hypothetical protein
MGKSRSIRKSLPGNGLPEVRDFRWLSQALGNCIAQFVFVLGVQTPNVISLRDDVHDSHIRLALKCHEEIAPVEQGQGADLFVASIAVSEKRNVRINLHHRVPFLHPPTVMRSGAYCSLEATFAMVNFAQAFCRDSRFPNLVSAEPMLAGTACWVPPKLSLRLMSGETHSKRSKEKKQTNGQKI